MILLDASIIVGFWRKPTERARTILQNSDVSVAGVTCAELMHGARSPRDLDRLEQLLAGFSYLRTEESTWPQLGRNLNALRKAGVSVPFQDALLATLAVMHGLEVWTTNRHFEMMQAVLPELKLFRPDTEGAKAGREAQG